MMNMGAVCSESTQEENDRKGGDKRRLRVRDGNKAMLLVGMVLFHS